MIQCPNYSCQASNADGSQFCHQCQAPLPRRLLWAVGHHADTFKPGMLVADRYLCQGSRIFIDTQPGLPPGTLSELPDTVLPYLHLISYQIHLPQIYGWTDADLPDGNKTRLMFLENGAIVTTGNTAPSIPLPTGSKENPSPSPLSGPPRLLPSLTMAWPHGSATQQLHWLWQIAQLWLPLFREHVASTLLIHDFVRVEGPLIRLVQLQYWRPEWNAHLTQEDNLALTQPLPCTLEQLGKCWSTLLPDASPSIRPFLNDLCHHLTHHIHDIQPLLSILEQAIAEAEQSQTLTLQVATQTDQGPSRANNEDACFPRSGSVVSVSPSSNNKSQARHLVVVCDGIGGHHGGDIASNLAIETIIQQFQPPGTNDVFPSMIEKGLKSVVGQANDAISQLNDQEQRRDRQRMGTTLVMSWHQGHNCYLTHVGDSRAYWVTQWGCHQITLDDDVASREARLGYGTYRSVLYHPNSGALVQALGMGASQNLYPSVKRLILEGSGLLLLCSDGLSDQDLIDVCWESILLPVLKGQVTDLGIVSQQLVDTANTYNGHDNVTVGLVQWKTTPTQPLQLSPIKLEPHAPLTEPYALDSEPSSTQDEQFSHTATRLVAPVAGTARKIPSELRSINTTSPGLSQTPATSTVHSSPTATTTIKGLDGIVTASDQGANSTHSHPDILPQNTSQSSHLSQWASVLGLFILIGIGSALAYLWIPSVQQSVNRLLHPSHSTDHTSPGQDSTGASTPVQSSQPSYPTTPRPPTFEVGHVITLKTPFSPLNSPSFTNTDGHPPPVILFEQPPETSVLPTSTALTLDRTTIQELGIVPWGSILNVKSVIQVSQSDTEGQSPNQRSSTDGRWLQVQLCSSPNASDSRLPPGSIGWVQAQHLDGLIHVNDRPDHLPSPSCSHSSESSPNGLP